MEFTQSHKATKRPRDDQLEHLAKVAVDCGYRLHPDIGPGLLESVYEMLLVEYLVEQGLSVARQIAVPISFKRRIIQNAFRADLIVEHRLLIELKSVEQLSRVHGKQVLTYLRLLDLPLGLLTNFGMDLFRDGVRRIANNYGA